MKKNKQLGQGLGALLTPSKNNLEDFNQSSILLSKIKPNPNQPRKNFEDKDILDKELQLMNSMFCLSETELYKELAELGKVTKIWQSYNFMGFVINGYDRK